ncbi:MAG: hypothetical protein K2N05_06825 [Muribaculaceae bacterium]|nr:hypothetical protein [Muribaculaceae bacterium]
MNISTLTKTVAVSAFFFLGSYSAEVYAETVDLGSIQPGKEYSWPQFATVTGTYTPSETGPVKFEFSTTTLSLYSSADHSEASEVFGEHSYSDRGKIVTYKELQGGTTYYVFNAFSMDAGSMRVYEGTSEIKLTGTDPSINPEDPNYYGGKLSASMYYEMLVNFNFPVSIGNVFLVAPDNSRVQVAAKAGESSVGCDIGPAMMQLYHEEKIKEGDEVTLRIMQVADASDKNNKYNENGRCEINFTVAAKPLELVDVLGAKYNSVDNIMNSYYLPGDEDAQIKFVFDGPLSSDKMSVASIEYGNSDNIEVGMYYENIDGTHDGTTATYDFSGKRRRPIDMLPNSNSSTQPESIYVSCGNIYSPDGQRAYTGSKSNPTGYPMSFVINVLQYTVVGDFTPARGTELVFGSPMEIWVMNGDKIKYDAIRFDYKENGEDRFYDIPTDKVNAAPDEFSEGAMLYTFTIPTLNCDPDSDVFVSMKGLECADGLDHSNDIRGEFKAKVSGIENVVASGSETFDVYDIAGVRVLNNVKADVLSSLAKGIYVINGKKVVIR